MIYLYVFAPVGALLSLALLFLLRRNRKKVRKLADRAKEQARMFAAEREQNMQMIQNQARKLARQGSVLRKSMFGAGSEGAGADGKADVQRQRSMKIQATRQQTQSFFSRQGTKRLSLKARSSTQKLKPEPPSAEPADGRRTRVQIMDTPPLVASRIRVKPNLGDDSHLADSEREALKAEVEAANVQMKAAIARAEAASTAAAEAKAEAEKLRREPGLTKGEQDALKAEVETAKAWTRAAVTQAELATTEAKEAKAKAKAEVEREQDALKAEVEAANAQAAAAIARAESATTEAEEAKAKAKAEVEGEQDALKAEVEAANAQMTAAIARAESANTEAEEAKAKAKAEVESERDRQQRQQNWATKRDTAHSQMDQAIAQADAAAAEAEDAKEEAAKLKQEIHLIASERDALKAEIEAANAETRAAVAQAHKAFAEAEESKSEAERLRQETGLVESERDALLSTAETANAKMEKAIARAEAASAEAKEAKEEVAKLQRDVTRAESDLAQAKEMQERAQSRTDPIDSESTAARRELQRSKTTVYQERTTQLITKEVETITLADGTVEVHDRPPMISDQDSATRIIKMEGQALTDIRPLVSVEVQTDSVADQFACTQTEMVKWASQIIQTDDDTARVEEQLDALRSQLEAKHKKELQVERDDISRVIFQAATMMANIRLPKCECVGKLVAQSDIVFDDMGLDHAAREYVAPEKAAPTMSVIRHGPTSKVVKDELQTAEKMWEPVRNKADPAPIVVADTSDAVAHEPQQPTQPRQASKGAPRGRAVRGTPKRTHPQPRRSASLGDVDGPSVPTVQSVEVVPFVKEAIPLALTMFAEDPKPVAACEHSLLAHARIKLPVLPVGQQRSPLHIVCVVDNSGSMKGETLRHIRDTVALLVRHCMRSSDRLGLVEFNEGVETILELESCDAAGRDRALRSIGAMQARGKSNLSLGLVRGIRMLSASQGVGEKASTPTSAQVLMLFTDADPNRGVTDEAGLLRMSREALDLHAASKGSYPRIFAFGFGPFHHVAPLQHLAEQSNGRYYNMDTRRTEQDRADALTSCIAAIRPVAATDATLTIEAIEGMCTLAKPLQGPGGYPCSLEAHKVGGRGAVRLGSIFWGGTDAEDEHSVDILFELHLPRMRASLDHEPVPAVNLVLTYTPTESQSQAPPSPPSSSSRQLSQPALTRQQVSTTLHLLRPSPNRMYPGKLYEPLPSSVARAGDSNLETVSVIDQATRLTAVGSFDEARRAFHAVPSRALLSPVAPMGSRLSSLLKERTVMGSERRPAVAALPQTPSTCLGPLPPLRPSAQVAPASLARDRAGSGVLGSMLGASPRKRFLPSRRADGG